MEQRNTPLIPLICVIMSDLFNDNKVTPIYQCHMLEKAMRVQEFEQLLINEKQARKCNESNVKLFKNGYV